MNFDEAINFIHGTLKFGSKLGLNNITQLLELMGDPHKKLKFVHVAGTNGKGSTVAFTSSILMEAGYRVGVYISPYLLRFTERISINNVEISCDDLARLTTFVKSKVDEMVLKGYNHPTEFEIVSAIAFQYYYEKQCDIVVLEVGLGGRFDSTNVIDTPEAAVITTISYDHMGILGNTLAEIAFEKAGIIKKNCDVVLYPQSEEVMEVFREVCGRNEARINSVDFSQIRITEYGIEGQIFEYKGYKNLRISMLGEHQVKNAVMAVNTAELLSRKGYRIDEDSIRRGIYNAKWPGRFEIISKKPLIMIDGAHNAEGARVLVEALQKYFPEKKKIFIFGVLRDKDYQALIDAVVPVAHGFITVTPQNERALSAGELASIIKTYCENVIEGGTIREAVMTAVENWSPDQLICAFGSLYYIGEVRKMFIE